MMTNDDFHDYLLAADYLATAQQLNERKGPYAPPSREHTEREKQFQRGAAFLGGLALLGFWYGLSYSAEFPLGVGVVCGILAFCCLIPTFNANAKHNAQDFESHLTNLEREKPGFKAFFQVWRQKKQEEAQANAVKAVGAIFFVLIAIVGILARAFSAHCNRSTDLKWSNGHRFGYFVRLITRV